MVQALPTVRQLLRGQGPLETNLVMIRFVDPIPLWAAHEFMRVHLTSEMLAGGERTYYQVGVTQPHKIGPQHCTRCRAPLRRVGEWDFICVGDRCDLRLKKQTRRPSRGVVRVEYSTDWVIRNPGEPVRLDRLVLVLDRRYREEVLAAIYRTAGMLADQMGWRIK